MAESEARPIVDRDLDFLSSVRFGVSLLCILVVLSMIGMLIIQQNVQGFDAYYASLTPAERLVYGSLGLFDIYHSWYFNVLLLVLSLNIILASIDRSLPPGSIYRKPKLTATSDWLLNQKEMRSLNLAAETNEACRERSARLFEANGFKTPDHGIRDYRSTPSTTTGKKIFDKRHDRSTDRRFRRERADSTGSGHTSFTSLC